MCNMNTKHHLNILMDKLHLVSAHIAHGKRVKDSFSTSLWKASPSPASQISRNRPFVVPNQ